jgi:hypothetical protein
MKKFIILTLAIGLLTSSCLPAPATDIPTSAVDLNATAAVFAQQTLEAIPSFTTVPSNTPVVVAESATTAPSDTPTVQAGTVTLTTTGTVTTPTGTLATTGLTVTVTATGSTATITPNVGGTPTQTLHPRFYGTLPPNLPYNGIELLNRSKVEAYISLQGTTIDGYTTILEYPVGGLFTIQAPVGKYKYVAWVGGNKIIGSFVLGRTNDVRVTIYKDRIEVRIK